MGVVEIGDRGEKDLDDVAGVEVVEITHQAFVAFADLGPCVVEGFVVEKLLEQLEAESFFPEVVGRGGVGGEGEFAAVDLVGGVGREVEVLAETGVDPGHAVADALFVAGVDGEGRFEPTERGEVPVERFGAVAFLELGEVALQKEKFLSVE